MLIYLDSALVCTGRIIQMYFVNYRAKINCMKEFTEFGEFYNFCLFIIKNYQELGRVGKASLHREFKLFCISRAHRFVFD